MNVLDEEPPLRLPAGKCPKCGRFSRAVRFVHDASPLSAEEGGYVVVDCRQHGEGIA